MTLSYFFWAVLCVVGLAAGQILFKLGARQMAVSGSLLEARTLLLLSAAFALYVLLSLCWVWLLQKVDLGRAYPLMALAFVFVPLGSYLFLGERFTPQYFVGVAFIMTGIAITIKA